MSSNSTLRPERDITKCWISGRHQFQSNAQQNAASASSTASATRNARKRRGGRAGVGADPEDKSRILLQSTRRAIDSPLWTLAVGMRCRCGRGAGLNGA